MISNILKYNNIIDNDCIIQELVENTMQLVTTDCVNNDNSNCNITSVNTSLNILVI